MEKSICNEDVRFIILKSFLYGLQLTGALMDSKCYFSVSRSGPQRHWSSFPKINKVWTWARTGGGVQGFVFPCIFVLCDPTEGWSHRRWMDWGVNTRITGNHPDGRSQLCSWWKLIDCFSIFYWKCTLLQPISHYWCSYYPFVLYCPVICSLMEQMRLECKSSMVFLRAEKQTNASADWLITPIIFITGESISNANTSILGLLLLLPSALCVLYWLYVDEKWTFSCWTWRTRFQCRLWQK